MNTIGTTALAVPYVKNNMENTIPLMIKTLVASILSVAVAILENSIGLGTIVFFVSLCYIELLEINTSLQIRWKK